MKIATKIISVVGIALFFAGCTGNSVPLHKQQKTVRQVKGHYYYLPVSTEGGKLRAKSAYVSNITSSGLLQCKKNYLWIANTKEAIKAEKAVKLYTSILTPSEIKEFTTHSTSIPKKNSKEFQNLIKVETKLAKYGQSYCIRPMSQKEVKQYQAYLMQQQKINNDPQVIAARANQQAAMLNYQAATATKNVNYNVNHSGFVNYSGSVYHY